MRVYAFKAAFFAACATIKSGCYHRKNTSPAMQKSTIGKLGRCNSNDA
jgi:hypothetical protein